MRESIGIRGRWVVVASVALACLVLATDTRAGDDPPEAGGPEAAAPAAQPSPASLRAEADRLRDDGAALVARREFPKAEQQYRRALALYDRLADPVEAVGAAIQVGDCLLMQSRITESFAAHAEAYRRAREGFGDKDHEMMVHALTCMMGGHWRLNRPDQALPFAEQALAMAKRVFGDEHRNVVGRLNEKAMVLQSLRRWDDALTVYRQALTVGRTAFGGDHEQVATILSNMSGSHIGRGNLPEALRCLQDSLAMVRRLGPGHEETLAGSTNNLAYCLQMSGRIREALPLYRESLGLRRTLYGVGDHRAIAVVLQNIGWCLTELGRPAEAREPAENSVAMWRRIFPGDHPRVARAVNDLAGTLLLEGDFSGALRVSREALAMWRRLTRGKDYPDLARSLSNIGVCLDTLGRGEEALTPLREAVAMHRRLHPGDHQDTFHALRSLAGCLGRYHQDEESLRLYEEAVAMGRRVYRGGHAYLAHAISDTASMLRALDRPEEGLAKIRLAIEMLRRLFPDGHLLLDRSLALEGSILADLGRHDEAVPLLEKALAGARRSHEWTTLATASAQLGWLHLEALEDPDRAAELFGESFDALEGMRRGPAEIRDRGAFFESLKRWTTVLDGLVAAHLARGDTEAALMSAERARARSVLDLLSRARFDLLDEARQRAEARGDEDLLRRMSELAESLARVEQEMSDLAVETRSPSGETSAKAHRGRMRELIRRRRTHRELLRERDRLAREVLREVKPASLASIRGLLTGKERLLVYAIGDRGPATVFVVRPTGEPVTAHPLRWPDGTPLKHRALIRSVDAYLGAVLRGRGASDAGRGLDVDPGARGRMALAEGHRLFRALVPAPLWKEIRDAPVVHVIPHGVMHRLPLETLIVTPGADPARRVYWLDAGPPLAYGPSGSALVWSRSRRDEQIESGLAPRLVALGDPVFRREADPKLPADRSRSLLALPGTRQEVEAIRRCVTGEKGSRDAAVVCLLGEEATERGLFEAADSARILHLATHHVVDETGAASHSGLALTAPATPTPEDDGFLRLIDVLERWRGRLRGCELVVLSACETQRGRLRLDEGVFAMPWGFQYAGCPSVIASLWRVGDESTADLMTRFYRRQKDGRWAEGKLRAFVEARKELRRTHPAPFAWAPFVYLGDPR